MKIEKLHYLTPMHVEWVDDKGETHATIILADIPNDRLYAVECEKWNGPLLPAAIKDAIAEQNRLTDVPRVPADLLKSLREAQKECLSKEFSCRT